jgi:hypothetical protein
MKLRLILATILAALLVTLTGGPSHAENIGARWAGTIRVYDATGDARWGVAQAAREWAASGVPIVVVTTPCAPGCVTVIEDPYLTYAGLATWSLSGTTITSCTVRLLSSQAGLYWAHHVVSHELGHCLGLAHTTHKGSVMLPDALNPCCPIRWDLSQLRGLYR